MLDKQISDLIFQASDDDKMIVQRHDPHEPELAQDGFLKNHDITEVKIVTLINRKTIDIYKRNKKR